MASSLLLGAATAGGVTFGASIFGASNLGAAIGGGAGALTAGIGMAGGAGAAAAGTGCGGVACVGTSGPALKALPDIIRVNSPGPDAPDAGPELTAAVEGVEGATCSGGASFGTCYSL